MHRRDFLRSSAAGSSLVAFTGLLPDFLGRTAAQAPDAQRPGARDTILVIVQLTGGNDGLNTVIPYNDADYARLRPTLRQTTHHRIDDRFAFHSSMEAFQRLLQDNALCVVQGVG